MFVFWGLDQFVEIFIKGFTELCKFDKEEYDEINDQTNYDPDFGVLDHFGDDDGPDNNDKNGITPRWEIQSNNNSSNQNMKDQTENQSDQFVKDIENFIVKTSCGIVFAYFIIFYIIPSNLITLIFVDALYFVTFIIIKVKGQKINKSYIKGNFSWLFNKFFSKKEKM